MTRVVLANTLLTQYFLQDVIYWRTNFHLLTEEFGLIVIARLHIVEDVRQKDDLKLVHVKHFGYVEEQFVRVVSRVVLRCLVQNLVGFVGEPTFVVLSVEFFITAACAGFEGTQSSD